MAKRINGAYFKMSSKELQEYIKAFRNREHSKKRGKGSYNRRIKHKKRNEEFLFSAV